MKTVRTIGYVVLTLIWVVNVWLQWFEYERYVLTIEQYLSFDKHVSYPKILLLRINALFMLGYYVLWSSSRRSIVQYSRRELVVIGLIIMLTLLNFLRSYSPVINAWFVEDGFFENMTVVFLLTAVVLILGSWRYFKDRISRLMVSILAFGLFFLAMEEISWGQRLFGWTTSDSWSTINDQQETNLHNVWTIPFLNNLFSLALAGILIFLKSNGSWIRRFVPQESLIRLGLLNITHWYIILFLFLGILGNGELLEEEMSVMGLYVAWGMARSYVQRQ